MIVDAQVKDSLWDKRVTELVRQEGLFISWRSYNRARFNTRWHRHAGIEILYCQEGEGVLALGRNVFPYSCGTLVLFNSHTPHRVRMRSSYARWNLCFLPEAIDRPTYLSPYLLELPRAGGAQYGYIVRIERERDDRRIRNLFADLYEEATEKRKGASQVIALRLTELLLLLERYWEQSATPSRPLRSGVKGPLLHEILVYVENHLSDRLSVQSLARHFHLSDSYLYRLMHAATGQSPSQYIISRRIARARHLLENTPMTISEIARAVGIASTSYFCQLFKRHVGRSPRSYRER